jgi:hypothetical protein
LVASLSAGCGDDNPNAPVDAAENTTSDATTSDIESDVAPAEDAAGENDAINDAQADVELPDPALTNCDPLQESVCALPWPSSLYLQEDPARATGYTLQFGATTLPANNRGVHISPEDYRRLDGYGVGPRYHRHADGVESRTFTGRGQPRPTLARAR